MDTYKLARKLSSISWLIYDKLNWQIKKILGDQFIESTDFFGANIAEGFGRYHYLDKVKFYYNSRGSLLESRHWFDLLDERKQIVKEVKQEYSEVYTQIRPALNALIKSEMNQRREKSPNY